MVWPCPGSGLLPDPCQIRMVPNPDVDGARPCDWDKPRWNTLSATFIWIMNYPAPLRQADGRTAYKFGVQTSMLITLFSCTVYCTFNVIHKKVISQITGANVWSLMCCFTGLLRHGYIKFLHYCNGRINWFSMERERDKEREKKKIEREKREKRE